ncbi:GerMN domain-containing protein [[Clostridium] colinum]|uniref:GerMN domain-containing protein n=1 Tax=[Clostridium] colinum TaxID=36835 RepID=UPI0020249940|nr:GerMN domain-containing protein [[Clostridium] colinum]
MKNNKKLFLFGVIFVIMSIVLITLISITSNEKKDTLKNISIYYYDKVNNNLVPEEKKVEINKDTFVNNIFEEMKLPSKSTNLKSVVPENVSLLDYNISNNTLYLNLSKNYNFLSDIEQLIFKAGLVWTMTEVNFINNIKILVDNKEIVYGDNIILLNRNNTILNPFISPDKIEQEKVILYFANNDNKLVAESRNIEFKQNKSMEWHIVEELINGPKMQENIKTLPSETKIRNVKTEDSICYVDLTSDFINKLSNNEEQERLAIYSIVNSLTNLSNVNKVQILIEGEKINIFKANIDVSQPIGRYENIIENNTLNNLGDKKD